MIDPKQRQVVVLLLCLLVGFLIRFHAFDRKALWIDEIHTFNDSRDGLAGQLEYYKKNPSSLHPPLFFLITHILSPFERPERDLRIIPLIFGTLAIPMIYLLSSLFLPQIALPCTLSLTFMTYHVYFSQDGRSYSLLFFLAMASTYFFLKYLKTFEKKYLVALAVSFALQFYTSYSSIPFIVFSQVLWVYRVREKPRRVSLVDILVLNGLTLLFCSPWLLFLAKHYGRQTFTDILTPQDIGSLPRLLFTILTDWVSPLPVTIVALFLLLLLPIFSKNRQNSFILLFLLILPVSGLYLYCKLLNITQMISSRYFVSFLPFFLVALFSSLDAMERRFERLRKVIRLKFIFLILFLASNLMTLPLYYRAEKQDFRGLVNYLNTQLRDEDKIIVGSFAYIPGLLHYFKLEPQERHYAIPYSWIVPGKEYEFKIALVSQGRRFSIHHSNIPYSRYSADQTRFWIVVGKDAAKEIKKRYPYLLKGHFDGSYSFFRRFPSDASMYLFIWDPSAPHDKGTSMAIE